MNLKKVIILAICFSFAACQNANKSAIITAKSEFKKRYLQAINEPRAELNIPEKINTNIKLLKYHYTVIRDAMPSEIIDQLQPVNISDYDQPTQNTIRLVEKLRNHQFDLLDAELKQVQQTFEADPSLENEQALFEAYNSFSLAFIEDLEHLNKWVEHSKPYSLMARATYLHNFAWLIRGHSFSYKIKKGNLDTTHHLALMARMDAFAVLAENDNNLPMLQMINRLAKLSGWYLRHNWFYGAAEKYPNSPRLINGYARGILTRWGGKQVQRDHFLNYLQENAPWALPKIVNYYKELEINTTTKEPLVEEGYYDKFLPEDALPPVIEDDDTKTAVKYAQILTPRQYYSTIIRHHKHRELDQCLAMSKLSFYFGHVTGKTLLANAYCHSRSKNYQQALNFIELQKDLFPEVMPVNRSKLQKYLKRRLKRKQKKSI